MIIIRDKMRENEVYFPKMRHFGITECCLTLKSEATLQEYEFFPEDDGCLNDYYIFHINFSEIPDGEYRYNINVIDNGLIRIGEIKAEKTQYNSKQGYKQYEG